MTEKLINYPKISIIIVNYNGRSFLEKCLQSISDITYPNYEIIIVDNNSSDDTIEFLKKNFPFIIIIKLEKNYGFAEPNNIAAKMAKGDFLLFLNNDTYVKPDFLDELITEISKDNKIAIGQSLLLNPNGGIDSCGDYIDKLGVAFSTKTVPKIAKEIFSAKGAAMIIRKNLFNEIGGFDKKFFATFEDIDLGWRARIFGYKIILVPKSIVYHIGGQTIRSVKSNIAFHGFKNQLSMKVTNFESSLVFQKLIQFLVIYGFREFRILLDYWFKHETNLTPTKYEEKIAQKPDLKIIFKAIWWIITNPKYLWKKHQLINSKRKISTSQLEKINMIKK